MQTQALLKFVLIGICPLGPGTFRFGLFDKKKKECLEQKTQTNKENGITRREAILKIKRVSAPNFPLLAICGKTACRWANEGEWRRMGNVFWSFVELVIFWKGA